MKTLTSFLLASLASFAIAQPASATGVTSNCAPRDKLVDYLVTHFDEHQAGLGLANQQTLYEFHVSKSGTFTIVLTHVNGLSCVMGTGTQWQSSKIPVGPDA